MALKAGYKGVKKSVLDSLLSLLGSLAIKDVGDGLTLDSDGELSVDVGDGLTFSSDGELSADIDTDTMEFKDGKLSALVQSAGKIDLIGGSDDISTATPLSTIDISAAIDNYDIILLNSMFYQNSAITAVVTSSIPVSTLKKLTGSTITTPHWLIAMNPHTDTWERIQYDSGVLKIFNSPTGVGMMSVYGIKF